MGKGWFVVLIILIPVIVGFAALNTLSKVDFEVDARKYVWIPIVMVILALLIFIALYWSLP